MKETLKITYTPVNGENTKLKKDGEWYEVILGAFNILNNNHAYYDLGDFEQLLRDPKQLICQRLENGYLKGEMGHPVFTPGMDSKTVIATNLKMSDEKVSHAFKEIELVKINNKQKDNYSGKPIYIVKGIIKPTGPFGPVLKESLDDPYQNTAFSLRSITEDNIINGQVVKTVVIPITWDFVTEPGVVVSNKANAVTFDGKSVSMGNEVAISHINIDKIREFVSTHNNLSITGNESNKNYIDTCKYIIKKYDKSLRYTGW